MFDWSLSVINRVFDWLKKCHGRYKSNRNVYHIFIVQDDDNDDEVWHVSLSG